MDYDNLNSNLKYNIEHTMGYADVETSTDPVSYTHLTLPTSDLV